MRCCVREARASSALGVDSRFPRRASGAFASIADLAGRAADREGESVFLYRSD